MFATLATQVGGGIGAAYLDREYGAKYDQHFDVGNQHITLTVGAMASLALALGLAFIPGGVSAGAKGVLLNLAGGGLVYEGIKAGETQVLPALGFGAGAPPAIAAPPAVQGLPWGGRHPSYSTYQMQAGLPGYVR